MTDAPSLLTCDHAVKADCIRAETEDRTGTLAYTLESDGSARTVASGPSGGIQERVRRWKIN